MESSCCDNSSESDSFDLTLLFTCLFLDSYVLVDVFEVISLIEDKTIDWFREEKCFRNLLLLNRKLNALQVILYDNVSCNFLGAFSERTQQFGKRFPADLKGSCHKFFERLFDATCTPADDEQLDEIVDYVAFSVQFEEATSSRVTDALNLLDNVTELAKFRYQKVVKDGSNTDVKNVNYRDTKHCECVEYDMSGDCSCTYD